MLHIVLAHGTEAEINAVKLKFAELAVATDSYNIFIGTAEGNKSLANAILQIHLDSTLAHNADKISILPPITGIIGATVYSALSEISSNYINVLTSINDINSAITIINDKNDEQDASLFDYESRIVDLEASEEGFTETQNSFDARLDVAESTISAISNNYVKSTNNQVNIVNSGTSANITVVNPNTNTKTIYDHTGDTIKESLENVNNPVNSIRLVYGSIGNTKTMSLMRNKDSSYTPTSNDDVLTRSEINTIVQSAIANVDTGLDEPLVLDLESNLPATGTKGENYFVQNMDVTSPGSTGRIWWNDTVASWERLVYTSSASANPDNVTLETKPDGSIGIKDALVSLVNNSEQVSNKVLSINASSTDVQYPSAKAVYTAMEDLHTERWTANQPVLKDYIRFPTNDISNSLMLVCQTGGTTGATEPSWPPVDQSIVDGTATWLVVSRSNLNSGGAGRLIGDIFWVDQETPTDGAIFAQGQLLSRAVYAALWAVVQDRKVLKTEAEWQAEASKTNNDNGIVGFYSSGDGSTYFRVPNLRGAFLRGSLPIDNVGDFQNDAIRNITGSAYIGNVDGYNFLYGFDMADGNGMQGAFKSINNVGSILDIRDKAVAPAAGATGLQLDASAQVPTANENRPKSVVGNYCIQYTSAKPDLTGIDLNDMMDQVNTVAQKISVPVGTVLAYTSTSNVPAGFLVCNGEEYDQSVYPDLFSVIGVTYGSSGSGKFNVPDYTGLFLRGLGGNSDVLGIIQNDAIRNITGAVSTLDSWLFGSAGGALALGGNVSTPSVQHVPRTGTAADNLAFNASNTVPTANENRPVNQAVVYIIKAFDAILNDANIDINNALSSKSNVDLDNLSNEGKAVAASLSFPSSNSIVLALPASEGTIVMPGDGWLVLDKAATATGQFIFLIDQTTGLEAMANASIPGVHLAATLPVSKNDVVLTGYTAVGATNVFKFVYARGAV